MLLELLGSFPLPQIVILGGSITGNPPVGLTGRFRINSPPYILWALNLVCSILLTLLPLFFFLALSFAFKKIFFFFLAYFFFLMEEDWEEKTIVN